MNKSAQHNMRRVMLVMYGATLMGCTSARNVYLIDDRLRTPFVLEYELAPGAEKKTGVRAVTDAGSEIFAVSTLTERNNGLSSFGGTVQFPRWVQITWREGVTDFQYWTSGTIAGNYRVEVLSRIPDEVFALAKAAPNRAIKLEFRIKNDRVLFAWSVEEHVKGGFTDIFHDGDFKKATLYNGKVIDPGWEK